MTIDVRLTFNDIATKYEKDIQDAVSDNTAVYEDRSKEQGHLLRIIRASWTVNGPNYVIVFGNISTV